MRGRRDAPAGGSACHKALFSSTLQAWKERVGWSGFFALLNYAPHVVPTTVRSAPELLTSARFDGAFALPAPPASGLPWLLLNGLFATHLFVNNYGRHAAATRAVARAFVWDWLGMAATVPACGCVSINGAYLVFTRWTRAGLAAAADLLEPVLGAPRGEVSQMEC